jgi:site-specific DNA-methyltransferase (adenine-specific)
MFRGGKETSGQRLAEHQGTMYDDEPTKVMDVLDQVFMHAARVLKPDGHAYVFFHMTRYEGIYLMLRKHFGHCDEVPIIWIKNTPGIGDPNQAWTYAYEPCFWVNRGRSLMKPQAFNYLKYDTVSKKIHGTQKPVPLLRHLIQASSVPGEVVLDPFAGSGSTCIAAAQLGCRFIGIEQHEPFHRSATEFISTELALVEQGANEEVPMD